VSAVAELSGKHLPLWMTVEATQHPRTGKIITLEDLSFLSTTPPLAKCFLKVTF